MTVTSTTKPDVDLTDGAFYAGDSRAVYRWMRENEPVFRDRNGLAAAPRTRPSSRPNANPSCSRTPAASGPTNRASR